MALSKSLAMVANEFHAGECKRTVGPRGGITTSIEAWRRNGATKAWKRSPERYQVPVKYGLYRYGYITESDNVHVAEDCPLLSL